MEFNRKEHAVQRCGYRPIAEKAPATTGERSAEMGSEDGGGFSNQIEIISSIFPGRKS